MTGECSNGFREGEYCVTTLVDGRVANSCIFM